MGKPRVLDGCCGAGGMAMGLSRAGWDVVGVDLEPQPHYPFEFVQGDVIERLADPSFMARFDAVHVSPPCQDHSAMSRNYGAPLHGTGWLLAAVLERLAPMRLPWVVENVVGAAMPSPVELCGASFGLGASGLDLNRHRLFQANFAMLAPPCQHRRGQTMGVYGHGTNAWHRKKLGRNLTIAEMREAMGIDWMTLKELTQAIPPAMGEWIGTQLLASLEKAA